MYTNVLSGELTQQNHEDKSTKKVHFAEHAVELFTYRPATMPQQSLKIRTLTKQYDGPSLNNLRYVGIVMYWIYTPEPTLEILRHISFTDIPHLQQKISDLVTRLLRSRYGRVILAPQGGFNGSTVQLKYLPKLYQLLQFLS